MQRTADGTDVPVPPEPEPHPDDRTVRGPDGVPIASWGEMDTAVAGDPGWWASANCDVRTFHSEDDARQWITEQLL